MSKRKYDPTLPRIAFTVESQVPASGEDGYTVRVGRKWLDIFQNHGDRAVVLTPLGKPVCEMKIKSVAYMRLDEVQASQLPKGLFTRQQLQECLAEAYSTCQNPSRQSTVDADTYVTVVSYFTY